jgi:phospholipid/cholesterol/gamma-HCH transport system permease protein
MPPVEPSRPRAMWREDGEQVVLELSGSWLRDGPQPEIEGKPAGRFPDRIETGELGSFDSTLPAYLLRLVRRDDAEEKPRLDDLPDNLRGLLALALAVPEESEARAGEVEVSLLARLGNMTRAGGEGIRALAEFTGTLMLSTGRFITGRSRFRAADFWVIVQQSGVEALPIVTLISFLIGLILAFVGNVQLASFGANLYVADLVGIAMVREMGAVMTGIIMSGRTGAAFAALIGSMKANEEIDALRTFGFNPFDFLVLPRVLALVLMMPILTVYSNAVGILGGMLVGAFVGIPPVLYWAETLTAVDLTNASLGVIKSVFFGAAIAASGCIQGLKAGNSSAAVGEATTRAVVASITAIIVLDSVFAVIFTILDI